MSWLDSTFGVSARVIAAGRGLRRWIKLWYGAYAILGALASGFAALLIPLLIMGSGGSALQTGAAIAALNIGALSAPLWGTLADRSKAYRAIFFGGFVMIAAGFAGFSVVGGIASWVVSAFVIGLGIGASNTVATLFVVEFTPREEWSRRISWLQTFNAAGSVIGMAAAGLMAPRAGMAVAAVLVLPALVLGGRGLPVPGGRFHVPHLLTGPEVASLVRRGGPSVHVLLLHLWRPRHIGQLARHLTSPFGTFLLGWFAFSLGVSSFLTLYPVLMQRTFSIAPGEAAALMSIATAASIPLYDLAGSLSARLSSSAVLSLGYLARIVPMMGLVALAYLHESFAAWGAIALYIVFQAVWPLVSVASNDLAASLAPFGEGPAMGLFNATAAIASAVGALAGGVIADRLGYPAVPAFAALALAVALLTVRHHRSGRTYGTPARTQVLEHSSATQ